MKLYIIGNGFDLNHNLPTSYRCYKDYLIEKGINIKGFECNEYFPNDIDDNWSDIETHLQVDYEQIMSDSIDAYYPGLSDESDSRWHNLTIELEIKTELINKITKDYFYEWICSIDLCDVIAKHVFNKNDLFVTFNYTKLLETKYGVTPFHIHGSVDDTIQFGNFENDRSKVVKELDSAYRDLEWFDVSVKPAIDTLGVFLDNSFKNYEFNKKRLHEYLNNKEIDEIIIMGHSYDGIDERYYKDIFLDYKCKWIIYCHGNNDIKKAKRFADDNSLLYKLVNW